jgi:hypothetical protein
VAIIWFFCGYCSHTPNSSCQVRSSAYFPGSLCQRRLRDVKPRKRWRNALKSLGPVRFSGAMLGSATFLCQKALSANDKWRRPRSWIRPTRHGSKTICRLLRKQLLPTCLENRTTEFVEIFGANATGEVGEQKIENSLSTRMPFNRHKTNAKSNQCSC